MNALKRYAVRFWNRHEWKGVIAVAAVLVVVLGITVYSLVHQPPTGASVAVHGPDTDPQSSAYAYDEPRGWDHDVSCGDGLISGLRLGSCTKPDSTADAGVYLFAQSVAVGRTDADVAGALGGQVSGFQPCGGSSGGTVCLQDSGQPTRKGELRVRVYRTLAVVVLCIGTERADIQRGCDVVWTHIHVTS